MRIKLREICHARSGDKGAHVNVGLVVYESGHYEWVRDHVTVEAVHEHFRKIPHGKVERWELPSIGAFNYAIYDVLGGGVSRSLMLDGHGKGFSAIFLAMEIDAPQGYTPTPRGQGATKTRQVSA